MREAGTQEPLHISKSNGGKVQLFCRTVLRDEKVGVADKIPLIGIDYFIAENEKLEARAKAGEKGKMKDTMERAKLKSELDNLQRLVDRIPPDILAELKRQQRHTVKER